MKKILFCLLFGTMCISCSDDDSKPAEKHLPTAMITSGIGLDENQIMELGYDNRNRITSITAGGEYHFTAILTYGEGDRLLTYTQTGYQNRLVVYGYDNSGRLNAVTIDGNVEPIVYDAQTGIYTTTETNFSFSADGDFAAVTTNNFTYESGKGAFADVRGNPVLLGLGANTAFLLLGSKKVLKNVGTGSTPAFSFSNSLNADGYLKSGTVQWTGGPDTYEILYDNEAIPAS